MTRIEYLPEDIADPPEIVAALRTRRGGRLNEVDRVLLYSPPLARGWNELAGAIRSQLSLAAKLRELAICGVGILNGSEFEFRVHQPEFIKAGGTELQAQRLREFALAAQDAELFDATERAVMQLTIEMTEQVTVSDQTFSRVAQALPGRQQLVELVGTIAMYNMASRLIVALRI